MHNIFIENLASTTSEDALRQMFEPFGEVLSVRIVRDRDTNAPRGFGFVEMSSAAAAKLAISAVNGTIVDGHALNVNEARPKPIERRTTCRQMRSHREHRY